MKVKGMMLTWNGEWGRIPEMDTQPSPNIDILAFCGFLNGQWPARQMFFELKELLHVFFTDKHIAVWSLCFELCTTTLREQGARRVHAHCFWSCDRPLRLRSLEGFTFKNARPVVSSDCIILGDNRGSGGNAGHVYILVDKIGSLFRFGTKSVFKDLLVNPEWINKLVQCQTITAKVARQLFIYCSKNVKFHVSNLELVEQ